MIHLKCNTHHSDALSFDDQCYVKLKIKKHHIYRLMYGKRRIDKTLCLKKRDSNLKLKFVKTNLENTFNTHQSLTRLSCKI